MTNTTTVRMPQFDFTSGRKRPFPLEADVIVISDTEEGKDNEVIVIDDSDDDGDFDTPPPAKRRKTDEKYWSSQETVFYDDSPPPTVTATTTQSGSLPSFLPFGGVTRQYYLPPPDSSPEGPDERTFEKEDKKQHDLSQGVFSFCDLE